MADTPHTFSQMLVGRYLFYGHDALAHCQAHRAERTAVTSVMDHTTAGMAKVLAFVLLICSPLALPVKFLLIELTQVLEKQQYDDPVGIAMFYTPNAFFILVTSCVLGLMSWLVMKGGKQLLKKGR